MSEELKTVARDEGVIFFFFFCSLLLLLEEVLDCRKNEGGPWIVYHNRNSYIFNWA